MAGSALGNRWVRGAVVGLLVLAAVGCRFHPSDAWSAGAVAARTQINALLDDAEAADAIGDAAAAQAARDAAAELEAEVFLPSPPVGTTSVLLDPTTAGGFFDAPWPSDTRLHPDGSIDLTGFPGRAANPIANVVLGRGEAATFGFGTNSAVYFRTSAELDPASVPAYADLTVTDRSPVMLLDLDDPTAPPVPLLVDFEAAGTPRRPSNLLTLLPYPGHPLAPSTRYAAVVFNGAAGRLGRAAGPVAHRRRPRRRRAGRRRPGHLGCPAPGPRRRGRRGPRPHPLAPQRAGGLHRLHHPGRHLRDGGDGRFRRGTAPAGGAQPPAHDHRLRPWRAGPQHRPGRPAGVAGGRPPVRRRRWRHRRRRRRPRRAAGRRAGQRPARACSSTSPSPAGRRQPTGGRS